MGVGRHSNRDEGDELLTPGEVAALFHVNTATVARWAQTGKIGCTTTIGGHRRYHSAEIRDFLRAHSDPGPAFR
ncbi:MAG: BldC family transcriptional regulator [Rhodococcus sp. (in: high G+C Gram-positive bacteria)]|nr:BldC family transcriptional regulator [Rhodococcus sp. (in: high G+C Gram-positive bacteria)]